MNKTLKSLGATVLLTVLAACASVPTVSGTEAAKAQLIATERAFARTMAERDVKAFAAFISEEAVFFSGPTPRRGKAHVVEWWGRYFAGPSAPFSWEPDEVEILESGSLAITSGPVRDPDGKLVGRFTSVWRLESPDTWRIVFDKGSPVCTSACP